MKQVFGLLVCSVLLFSCADDKTAEGAEATAASAPTAEPNDNEFGDQKFVDIASQGMDDLTKGDVDNWMTKFSDNAVYRWNNMDSLAGKPAIADYWKKRRTDVIDSLSLSNDIWLAIKVNKIQSPLQLTGNYVLGWHTLYAKYKTGKSISQRIHTVFHFDVNDKIDRVTQYLDRAPINAAVAK
jgi:hypothetical protein